MSYEMRLNFEDADKVQPCVDALKAVTPVPIVSVVIGVPDMRECLTMPEYLNVEAQARLVFGTADDRRAFMSDLNCLATYQRFAS